MLDQVGLPPGVVSVLPGDGEAGARLVGHRGVDEVAFTGSTAAGRQVAAACAANVTRVSLELGGKSAAIVLDDADPAAVAAGAQVAGLMNGGQACVAQTRYLVPRARHDEMVDALAARIAREEIFGPVLSVSPYRDEDEAVRLANDSDYGLSGSVWTADAERGLGVARRVRTGTFGVNQPSSMDPAAPFGGVKASGFGRELGPEGLDEFLDVKAISVAPGEGTAR
jgi:acyl-CoA reductase-like NAD-dependent aldehyde dehydrogenase